MKTLLLLIASLCSYALFAVPTFSSVDKYQRTLDYVHSMGKELYCYWDLKKDMYGVDWDQIISDAKDSITDETTSSEFNNILKSVAAGVKDGHVSYRGPSVKMYYYLPISFTEINDEAYIKSVDNDSFLNGSNLKRGDKVISIDNVPVENLIQQNMKYSRGSREGIIRGRAIRMLGSNSQRYTSPLQNRVIKVLRKNVEIEVELPWLLYDTSKPYVSPTLRDLVKVKILPSNIGHITIKSMSAQEGRKKFIDYINRSFDLLNNTRAIIIDVRNNGGGDGAIGDAVIARFIDHKVNRYKASLKNSALIYLVRPFYYKMFENVFTTGEEFTEWLDFEIEPAEENRRYTNPVVVLTNESCFSACDTFVDSFSSNKIGKVLGMQTAGGTGYPHRLALPHNMGSFRFSVLRGYSNHGRFLEGIGTIPDVPIKRNLSDFINFRDSQLIEAHSYMVRQLDGTVRKMAFSRSLSFKLSPEEVLPPQIIEEREIDLHSQIDFK